MSDTFDWFLGIDWGSEAHALCLLDAAGQIRGTRTVAHTAAAVHDAVQWVREQTGAAPAAIAVAIETPRGVLVDTLIEAGFRVFAINPKQLDRFRDRFTAAGAKDDQRDAQVLGDGLRTDRRAFRPVRLDDPLIIQLREVTRLREDLQEDERRLANRLRDQLYRVDAAWLTFSPAADESWLWAILAEAPDPATWAPLTRRRVAAILHTHRIRRVSADAILTALQQPRLTVAPGVTEAVATRIAAVVPQLQLIHDQRLTAERRIDRLLERLAEVPEGEPREHRDVEILQSLPGVGRMVTATMLTEATGPLAARDYSTLRAHTGAAPVTKRSGKRAFFVHMRYACKRRLRQAVYHWSRTSLQHDAAARAYYDRLRARGHSHARALRSVADRWLRILVAMLRRRTLYDPSQFAQISV
ncbi:MAG: IS110 family transposase [Vicinamibacterales bacterium]